MKARTAEKIAMKAAEALMEYCKPRVCDDCFFNNHQCIFLKSPNNWGEEIEAIKQSEDQNDE